MQTNEINSEGPELLECVYELTKAPSEAVVAVSALRLNGKRWPGLQRKKFRQV
jgi:hypothetical protein